MAEDRTFEGIRLRVEGAAGRPWVTFLNSIGTDLGIWDDQAAAISDRYRVLRLDAPGHGGSAPPEGPFGVDAHVAMIVRIWDHLGVEKTHVVGVSMGGKLSLALGALHPDRVLSVMACACREPADAPLAAGWRARIEQVREHGMKPIAEGNETKWFPEAFRTAHPDRVRRIIRMMLDTDPKGYMGCAAALTEERAMPLERIRVPTMLVGGTEDKAITARLPEIRARAPGSTLEIMEGAGHLMCWDQPEAFNRLLERNLAAGDKVT